MVHVIAVVLVDLVGEQPEIVALGDAREDIDVGVAT
jgi:hypothetical protein